MSTTAYADLGTLWINIAAKNQAGEEFDKIRAKAATVGKEVEALGKKFTTYLTVPLMGLGALAIKEFASFEAAMSKVKATTNATADEMVVLNAKARELGKSTQYSATEVADAMNYMAMAGWNTTQIVDGLDGVLDLAAASGGDLATVSDIVTDALTAFGLSASDTTDFVDLLANVSRAANTNVEMLGESFKYVAPVSASLGISAEQTALALGLLANNGIKGSQAGTTLRAALNQLVKPSTEAARLMKEYGIAIQTADDGSVDLMATFASLKNGIANLDKTQQAQIVSTLVGTEAMSGVMAIINATEADIAKLTDATTNYSGSAKEMAETMNNNLKGNLNKLKSAFSELLIVVGENLVPIFTKLIEKVTEVVEWFGSLDEGTQSFIVKMGLVSTAIGPVLMTLGKITQAVTPLGGMMSAASTAVGGLGSSMGGVAATSGGFLSSLGSVATFLTNPWVLATGAAVAGLVALDAHMSQVPIMSFDETVRNIQGLSDETAQMVIDVSNEWDSLTENISGYLTDIETRTDETLQEIIQTATDKTSELVQLEQEKYEERKQLFDDYRDWTTQEGTEFYEEVLENDRTATDERIAELNRLNLERQNLIMNYDNMTLTEQLVANERIKEINEEFAAEEIGLKARTAEEILALIEAKGIMTEAKQVEFAQAEILRANEVRDSKIAAADEEYEAYVLAIANMKGQSEEAKEQMIRDARDRRTQTVMEANAEKAEVVDVLGQAYPELYKQIDYATGEISNHWQRWCKTLTSDHEGEMHALTLNMGKELGSVQQIYQDLANGTNQNLQSVIKEQSAVGQQATDMAERVKSAGKVSETSIKGVENEVDSLHKKLNALPTTKTVNVVINETTRQRTEVYGTTTVSGRSVFARTVSEDGTMALDSGLYNLTALSTGFNPSGEVSRYEQNERLQSNNTHAISTRKIEETLEKLLKALENFESLQVFLDRYTLIGELAPGISKELAKGVRMR